MAESITIRPHRDADLPQVAELLNRTDYMPASEGYPISPEELKRHLVESGTPLILVAEEQAEKRIVGTLCLTSVSEQRVAGPKEVFSSLFVVHPAYRNGSVANQLFIQMLYELLHRGYFYLSATVNPANVTAMALYKRIGLFRTRECVIDYDGELELRGYQPLLIKLIIQLCLPATQKGGIVRREHAWRFLSAPQRSKLREGDYDTIFWHGLEVATYETTVESWNLLFRFDVHSNLPVEIRIEEIHFQLYPEQGEDVCVGDPCSLVVSLTNLADSERTYGVTLKDLAPDILPEQPLAAGASWQRTIPFTPQRPGRQMLRATLQTERGPVEFCAAVTARYAVEAQRSEPLTAIYPDVPWRVQVQLTNRRNVPLQGHLQLSSPTLPALRCTAETLSLAVNETVEVTLLYPEPLTSAQAINEVALQFVDDEGTVHSVTPLVIPLQLDESTLAYRQEGAAGQESWTLESLALKLQLDAQTGYALLWERASEKMILREPWPNLGPPMPGGLKRSLARDITFSVLEEEGGAGLLAVEHCANGERLQRSFHFTDEHLLEIRQRWFPAENQEQEVSELEAPAQGATGQQQRAQASQSSRLLRTFGWCMLRRTDLTIPLRDGWQSRQFIYNGYPFMRHEAETIPFGDLPRAADNYPACWSAFTEDDLVVGTLWQDVNEVRYGGAFIPSLVYELPTANVSFCDLPPYAYYVGSGDAHTVESIAQQWQAGEDIDSDIDIDITPSPAKSSDVAASLPAQQYEETLLTSFSSISPESVVRDAMVVLEYKERQDSYSIKNDPLRWQVAGGFAGSMVNLHFDGHNLLQSPWPRTRLFGNHNPWYGGLYPGLIEDPTDLLQGSVTDPCHLQDFSAQETYEYDAAGRDWFGVELTHEDLRYTYDTVPGLPLIRLSFELINRRATSRQCTMLLHLFLRGLHGTREPKRVYYEYNGRLEQFREEQHLRHLYCTNWCIITLGKECYAVLGAPSELQVEIATYEWGHDGFEHALLCPMKVAAGQRQRAACYLWFTHSLEQAQAMLNALKPVGVFAR